jgi:hypothetical protein
MSLSIILAKIKSKLTAISGVENVYDYHRYCNDWVTYKELFVKDSKVNTWEIVRDTFTKTSHGGNGNVVDTENSFIIRGFYSVYDVLETEKTFQNLVETICEDFMDDPTLGGTAEQLHYPITGQFTIGKLGDVMTHVVDIRMTIKDRKRI